MNNKNNTNIDANNSQQLIPCFVGYYNRLPEEKIPEIIEIDSGTDQTLVERRICNFFKCTKSLMKTNSDESEDKCFATRNSENNFLKHLNERHPDLQLYCVYCYPKADDKTYVKTYIHRYLVKHMRKRHRFRRYQCNQCLYRAITEDHVNIHQSVIHKSFHTKAVTNQQNGDELKCKIFKCIPINTENSVPNLYYYYNKFKTDRFNTDGKNETLFQCLYCDFMNKDLRIVVEHCVERHPDYPLMYFIPEPQVSSSTSCRANENFSFSLNNTVIPIIEPKIEPQDSSVSSTSPLKASEKVTQMEEKAIVCNNGSVKRKWISSDCQNALNIYFNAFKRWKANRNSSKGDSGIELNSYDNNKQKASDNSLETIDNSIESVESVENLSIAQKSDNSVIKENDNKLIDVNSDKSKEMIDQKYICLFCDQLFIDREEAKSHLESHFPDIAEATDDYSLTKLVQQWISQFLLKQHQLSSYESTSELNESQPYYRCPICVKISQINERRAKHYSSWREVKTHIWQHSCWQSVRCKNCNVFVPNCDSLIAGHLYHSHQALLALPKNQNFKFLTTNETTVEFTVEQRLELAESFVEFTNDRVIDPFIKRLLIKAQEESEQRLRVIHDCHRYVAQVFIYKLPILNFDNKNMVKKYLKKWNKEEKRLNFFKSNNKFNDKSDAETVGPKKGVKSNDENSVDSKISDLIDSECEKIIESEFNYLDQNRDQLNEDINSLGQQIEKIYDKIINFDNYGENVNKSVDLNENKKKDENTNSLIECVPSTSRDTSVGLLSKAATFAVDIRGEKLVSNNDNSIPDDEYYRISCYHCNDKFKTMKEYREHHKNQHKRLLMRGFGKQSIRPHKTN